MTVSRNKKQASRGNGPWALAIRGDHGMVHIADAKRINKGTDLGIIRDSVDFKDAFSKDAFSYNFDSHYATVCYQEWRRFTGLSLRVNRLTHVRLMYKVAPLPTKKAPAQKKKRA